MNALERLLAGSGSAADFVAVCLIGGVAIGLVAGGIVSIFYSIREREDALRRGEKPGDLP